MQKQIGIIGFGVVGKSVLRFLIQNEFLQSKLCQNALISVWDQRSLSNQERKVIEQYGAKFIHSSFKSLDSFFDNQDIVVASPGIKLSSYILHTNMQNNNKITGELDLLASVFKKKTIAITGTLGKTTITKLLHQLMPQQAVYGGNVGIGMLDLVESQFEVAILELSSFQLNYNSSFAPDIALWTNFYPNHLDWHETLDDYLDAKCKIFRYQKENQYLILPFNQVFLSNSRFLENLKRCKARRVFVSKVLPTVDELKSEIVQNSDIFFIKNSLFYKARVYKSELIDEKLLFDLKHIPDNYSFLENWLFILTVLSVYKIDLSKIITNFSLFEKHRLELFATINNIDFYDDSKATVIQATMAAVCKLAQKKRSIILILGGISKGVDRSSLVSFLSKIKFLKKVFFLGKEKEKFVNFESYSSLKEIVRAIMHVALPGDQVLFSPSGASFDLFNNYKERGEKFKKEILNFSV